MVEDIERMKTYSVFLENPVSVNGMFFDKIITKGKRSFVLRIPVSKTKEFKEYCGWKFKEAGIPKFDGMKKIIVEVWGVWPDKRRRDLSNFSKAPLDAFKECGHVPDDNIILWREQDYWIEKGVYGLKLNIYESEIDSIYEKEPE